MSVELAPLWSRIHRRIGPSPGNHRIDWLLTRMNRGLNVDPEYQRGRVWTREQAEAFVGYFVEGGRMPAIDIRRLPDYTDEVVDGKQRLLALRDYVLGEIDAVLWSGERVAFSDFTDVGRRKFRSTHVPLIELGEDMSDYDVMSVYVRLNRGGTPHTSGEIDRVRKLMVEAKDG